MQHVLINSGLVCVKLDGQVDSLNAEDIQNNLQKTLKKSNCSSLVVDMSEVESLESSALMALVETLNMAQEHGKYFALAGITPSVQIILELTQLDQAFDIREDLLEVDSLSSTKSVALAA